MVQDFDANCTAWIYTNNLKQNGNRVVIGDVGRWERIRKAHNKVFCGCLEVAQAVWDLERWCSATYHGMGNLALCCYAIPLLYDKRKF